MVKLNIKHDLRTDEEMSTKTDDKPESRDMFTALREEISRLQGENKGLKGQNARLKKKSGGLGGQTSVPQPYPGENDTDSSQQGANQAANSHLARSYEKVCVDCGGPNEHFVGAPNVFCNGPECKGRIPMGHIDKEKVVKLPDGREDYPGVGKCFNCGKDDSAVMVAE